MKEDSEPAGDQHQDQPVLAELIRVEEGRPPGGVTPKQDAGRQKVSDPVDHGRFHQDGRVTAYDGPNGGRNEYNAPEAPPRHGSRVALTFAALLIFLGLTVTLHRTHHLPWITALAESLGFALFAFGVLIGPPFAW